jgi:hypothetical protein
MSVHFVMMREQIVDTKALAQYGPKAFAAAEGHKASRRQWRDGPSRGKSH